MSKRLKDMYLLQILRCTLVMLLGSLVLLPQLLPWRSYRLIQIDGASMIPTFDHGDVIIAKYPVVDDSVLGQIAVIGQSPKFYTHRAQEAQNGEHGVKARLQGYANAVSDPFWLTEKDVFAVPEVHVSGLRAALAGALTSRLGVLVILGCIIAIIFCLNSAAKNSLLKVSAELAKGSPS